MKMANVVICGGGFSGMLAALVCSRHAESITILEQYPNSEAFQYAGTPQSHHVHIMSKKGQILLERLLPGSLESLQKAGAVEVDWAQNTSWEGPEGQCPRYVSGLRSLLFSRKLLEKFLYAKIMDVPHILVRQARVKDLIVEDGRVKEILLAGDQKISGFDLCLDARGRTSVLKESLEPHIGVIPETIIQNSLRYVSTVLARNEPESSGEVQQYYSKANGQDNPLGYFASPIEGGRLILTAVDYHGTLARPFEQLKTHPFLKDKELGSIHAFGKLHNHHIHYERSRRWLPNLIVLGDAVCRLNPMYGHGLTLVAEQIEILESHLASNRVLNTRLVQRKIGDSIKVPWSMVAMDESRALAGRRPILHRLGHLFSDFMGTVVLKDKDVHRASIEVLHRVRSPLAFLHPLLLLKAMKVHLRSRPGVARFSFGLLFAVLAFLLSFRPASAAEIKSRMLATPTEPFHVLESGDERSPLVLFLHGFPEHAGMWKNYLAELGSSYHAVAVDLRGYNLSGKPSEDSAYKIPVLVEDVRNIVLALGHQQVFLVAHDWGGLIAWHAASRYPEMIRKLVVLNAPHPYIFSDLLRRDRDQRARSGYVAWLKSPWAETLLSFHDFYWLRDSLEISPSTARRDYQGAWSRGFGHSLKYYRANDFTSPAFRSLRPIDIPTLVLWGEQDKWLSPKNLEGLKVWASQVRIKRYPNATHWIAREEFESIAWDLKDFLK